MRHVRAVERRDLSEDVVLRPLMWICSECLEVAEPPVHLFQKTLCAECAKDRTGLSSHQKQSTNPGEADLILQSRKGAPWNAQNRSAT